MDKEKIIIKGPRINLIPLKEKNVSERYASWINDPEINKFLDTKKTTIEELLKYTKNRYNNPNCLFLGIYTKKTNLHIGNVKLEPIDFENKIATLGTLIGDKAYWGKGYATESYYILLNYAFKELKLDFIRAGIPLGHTGALKAVQNVGFEIEKKTETAYKVLLKKENFRCLY